MRDEREDLLQKVINLKSNLKTCKSELVQRENIAESLKRQARELRHTLNLVQTSGKDTTLYSPKSQQSDAGLEGPHISSQKKKARSSAKYAGGYTDERRSNKTNHMSKTPNRDAAVHTVDSDDQQKRYGLTASKGQRGGHPINQASHFSAEQQSASDARLNKLINDYKMENERCTMKISQLKDRLADQQEDAAGHDKIYAKSYRVANDKIGRRKAAGVGDKVPSYYHNSGGHSTKNNANSRM